MSKPDTAQNYLTPLAQIARELPADFAEEILAFTQTERRETFAALMSVVSAIQKFRPNIWRTWAKAKQREWLWSHLLQPRFADSTRQLLQDWLFNTRTAMLNTFLDALNIAHDPEGYIRDELPAELDAEKVRLAIDGILATYAAREVALYLRLFQYGHPTGHGWASIATILATDPRFAA